MVAALTAAGRAVADAGLIVGTAGNLSMRDGNDMLITPRGTRLGEVARCVRVRLSDGAVVDGAGPSSETPLHRAVYAATEAQAIVHTHSRFATVMSTLVGELPPVHYAMTAFGGCVRVAPYATFGSDKLASNVAAALAGRRATLLANHGAVTIGESIDVAVDLALQLEWLAEVAYYATLAGRPTLLADEQLDAVVEQAKALA
jgi:L-fuculose-phosphate aldolase